MSTANPFGKLKVERDPEEEEEIKKQSKPSAGGEIFVPVEQKKKKKVRPEKKEETAPADDEGFEQVNKHKAPRKKQNTEQNDEAQKKEHRQHKDKKAPVDPSKRPKKREFDRQSGTGRGRESAKGGAGGKGTWTGKKITEKNYDEQIIDKALNPEKYEKKERHEEKEEKEHEEKEHEEKEEGQEKEEHFHRERREKKGPAKEVDPKDLLERPEGAISLEEFLAQKKTTAQPEEKKEVVKPKETENLQIKQKKEEFSIGEVTAPKKGKGKAPKEKKDDKKDIEIDFQVGSGKDERRYDRKPKHHNQKFKFDQKDFPQLK